jgi:glycosyltransferase involved in cell wall biosynthesis
MRLLYLIDNFSLGGAQTVIKGLMENNLHADDCFAVALRRKEPLTSIESSKAISINSRLKYSITPLRFLTKFIPDKKIDILHCQLPRSVLFGYLLKRKFPELKYIIHEQGDVFESGLYSLLLRVFRKKADGILACSVATQNKLQSRAAIPCEKIMVLYNYVDLNRFSKNTRPIHTHFRIAFAGRIEKRKGWREFVKMAQHFSSDKSLRFIIAGSGTEEGKLESDIHKKKLTNLEFLGYQEHIEEVYCSADLLVIPSHFEPMGMVAIEAMACRTLVLAADVPGLNEVVKNNHNGWTFKAKSVPEMIKTIEMIRNYPKDKLDVILNHAEKTAESFSIGNFILKLDCFYQNIAK